MARAAILVTLLWAICAAAFASPPPPSSSTYSEPWTETVLGRADAYVLATLGELEGTRRTLTSVEVLEGREVPAGAKVYRVVEPSPLANLPVGAEVYLLLEQSSSSNAGVWTTRTPTSGVARRRPNAAGRVQGHIRISFHQGTFQEREFVSVSRAVFRHLHDQEPDLGVLVSLRSHLSRPPAAPEGDEARRFYDQHLALETLYYFGLPQDTASVLPFTDTASWHHRVSAARALGTTGGPGALEALLVLARTDPVPFVRVVAAQALGRLGDPAAVPSLQDLHTRASTKPVRLHTDDLDPRARTRLPTVKQAVEQALKDLGARPVSPGLATLESGPDGLPDPASRIPPHLGESEQLLADKWLSFHDFLTREVPVWTGEVCTCEPVNYQAESLLSLCRKDFQQLVDELGGADTLDLAGWGEVTLQYRVLVMCPAGPQGACVPAGEALSKVHVLWPPSGRSQ